jgi:hypothetical protein
VADDMGMCTVYGIRYTVYGILYTAVFVILKLDILELEYTQPKYFKFVVLTPPPGPRALARPMEKIPTTQDYEF